MEGPEEGTANDSAGPFLFLQKGSHHEIDGVHLVVDEQPALWMKQPADEAAQHSTAQQQWQWQWQWQQPQPDPGAEDNWSLERRGGQILLGRFLRPQPLLVERSLILIPPSPFRTSAWGGRAAAEAYWADPGLP
ncbi:hypothetical protein CMUS01_05604 [Colletotrichum musicola]|uniref:Uncharacterized protein n=1 Tax=Colletotrichum musicola TaxID=2175873 RepID=A0A8H6NJJ0_9PEZI|nr:hypothetical protein CMUS01_05604 [Colletotrichum musicola]